jgi:hypothetical protein
MAQTIYVHMNKQIKKIQINKKPLTDHVIMVAYTGKRDGNGMKATEGIFAKAS